MAYSGTNGGSSHSCRSYCNVSGYYNAGFSCDNQFCCGSANVRFCCGNSSLDISDTFPDKCRCAMSSCSYLSWDVLLPCIAAALFVILMVTICCCQGCRSCSRCRQVLRRQCLPSNSATVSNGPGGLPADLEVGQRTAGDSTFPNLPPYEFGPPKYESLELTEAPPKYEDIISPGQSETHVNSAFVGDSVTPEYTVTSDNNSVTTECTVTDDGHSHDTIVGDTSGPVQDENNSRRTGECPVETNLETFTSPNADGSCERLSQLPLHQSSSRHGLAPSAGSEVSTCPGVVVCQAAFTPATGQVRREHANANEEIPPVV